MSIFDLTSAQRTYVKQNYYCEMRAQEGAGVSYDELADIDNLVTDEQINTEYAGVEFVADDFFGEC